MKSNKILVTGGTGFFGLSLLEKIAVGFCSGWHFTMLSRSAAHFAQQHPEYSNLSNVSFVSADVCDLSAFSGNFDFIIHGATPLINQPEAEHLRRIIIHGTAEVLNFAGRSGAKKLLYISSGGVYGRGAAPFTEDSPCNPVTVYGKAKHEAEKLVLESKIPCSIMRGFAFCGKHLRRDAHFAFGNFIDDAMLNRDIIIKGNGTPLRSYMHSDDLADWLMTMLFKGKNRRIYNCGSDESVSIRSLAETIRDELKSSSRIKVLETPDADTPIDCYIPDISRAKQELGLKVTIKLRESINLSAVLSASQSI